MKYVVIRKSASQEETRRVRGGATRGGSVRSASELVPETRIETIEVDSAKARGNLDLQDEDQLVPALAMSLPESAIAFDTDYESEQAELRKVETANKCTWGIRAIGADQSKYTGKGIKVAILDTGIAEGHPAFDDPELKKHWNLRNFVDTTGDEIDRNVSDANGHGTHTAATIFGRHTSEGIRIGVAPGITDVLIGKVLNNQGKGSNDSLLRGLLWAAQEGADIILMSLGFDVARQHQNSVRDLSNKHGGGHEEDEAIQAQASWETMQSVVENTRIYDSLSEFLSKRGKKAPLVIAASGNGSHRTRSIPCVLGAMFPSAARGMVSVAAVKPRKDDKHFVAEFSNGANLAAPGVNILSANAKWDNDVRKELCYRSGTSMAAPHIAGLAALWMERLKENRGRQEAKLAEFALDALIDATEVRNIRVSEFEDESTIENGMPVAPTNRSPR